MTAAHKTRITEHRHENVSDFSLTSSLGTTTEIYYGPFKSGILNFPSTTTVTTVSVYVANEAGGTYNLLRDASGAAKSITVPNPATNGAAVQIPAEADGALYLKLVGNAADANAKLSLKN